VTFGLGGWGVALGVHVLALLPNAPSVPAAQDELCDASPAKVDAILDVQASAIAKTYRDAPARPDLGYYIASTACLSRCRKSRPEIASCLQNLNAFLDGNCQSIGASDRRLGADIPDRDYVIEGKKLFDGEMLSIPQEILDASSKYLGLTDFAKAIDRTGLKYVSYGSSLLDGRFAILVEGARFDRIIQFATSAGILTSNVDFIALQKRHEKTGAPLARPRAWFNGYNWVNGQLNQKTPLSTRCLSCHANGWRQIHTAYLGKLTPAAEASYAYFRKKIADSGPSDFAFFDPTHNGPPLGAIDPPGRVDAIAKGCGVGLAPDRQRAVADAMSCARCHDGKSEGILNGVTSYYWSLRHKVATLTDMPAATMPPAATLSRMERALVVACLRQEYAGQLRSWLKATSCSK
jgi:hypothetical protein